jgi:hypothetical protein
MLIKKPFLVVLVTILFFLYTWGLSKLLELDSFFFSWSITIVASGWAYLILDLLKPTYSSKWFDSFGFEKNGRLYKRVGVQYFRKFLGIIGYLKFMNPQINRDVKVLMEAEKGTRVGEVVHYLSIVILLLYVPIMIYFNKEAGILYLFINIILFQLYPIMLQRFNRPRYLRLIRMMDE